MRWPGWLRRWLHRQRWKSARRNARDPLREFVYLDDVSVYSLVASQVGMVVTELTETQASSLQSDVSSGLGVSVPFKAEVGSKVQAGQSQSTQVLRKAVIQSTFKQLHDTVVESVGLRIGPPNGTVPTVRTLDDVRRLLADGPSSSWVVEASQFRRGDLIEMDVQLEAEPIFQASAVISGLLDIIQDDPTGFGIRGLGELGQVRLVSRMLDKVLAGLVPVRGRSIDYEVIEVEGVELFLHRAITAQLADPPASRYPLFLVGVAQQALFWKDTRQVLFSGSSYRVLARLNRGGAQGSWTPIKLVDVLRDVIPDFATVMDAMNKNVLSVMSSAVASHRTNLPAHRLVSARLAYATLLAERAGVDISENELRTAGLLDEIHLETAPTVRDWRTILAPVTSYVEQRSGHRIDREVAADYRLAVMTDAGFLVPSTTAAVFDTDVSDADERFLDSEIVAVYW